jgi:exodeoxyribonuclease VII small subunit
VIAVGSSDTEQVTAHDDDVELDLTYAEALDELDGILAELEATTVDVDVLADRVARGAVLVRYCRQRLQVVQSDVEQVVETLLDTDGTDGSNAEPSAS